MIKKLIKSLLGEKNTNRLRRIKFSLYSAIDSAICAWHNFRPPNDSDFTKDQLNVAQLMNIHGLEKAMVIGHEKYLSSVKYDKFIDNMSRLIQMGVPPDDFTIAESAAVIRSALATLPGHEEEKSQLESLISQYNIPMNLRGGIEVIPSAEILSHTDFDFHAFVSSRHSVRKFKDKIIPREVIEDIVRDALYCPSACNRQPFKVYFSEDRKKIAQIIKLGADGFLADGIHDCVIITCDKALQSMGEVDDQEYVNGGIFLGYLVMSVHAHGLGSCLFQCLRSSVTKQDKIRQAFGISRSEAIVCCMGIGELEDDVVCACAQRRNITDVAVCLDD